MSSWYGTREVPEPSLPAPARRSLRRVGLPSLAVATIAIAAVVMVPLGIVTAASPEALAATLDTGFTVDASAAATRAQPFPLHGSTLAGVRYVFLATKIAPTTVTFWLDDVTMTSAPARVEKAAPWDFRGTADNESAIAWNTATVGNGSHTISVKAATAAGAVTTSATFAVANPAATPAPTPSPTAGTGPRISDVRVTGIGQTGATVSWTLDEPATGQVEFGTTNAYGRSTTPELSYDYTHHVQQLSGLVSATVYHFRVRSQDAAGHLSISPDATFATLGGVPTATPDPTQTPDPTATPAPGQSGIYGAAFNFDTKANLQVGWTDHAKVAHRFVASTTSALKSVRFQQRGGPIYSGGTGGTLRITVQTDANGVPSGTVLATATYVPGNPSGAWTTYDAVTFPSPATLSKGSRYYIVFENVDPNPVTNYFSVNDLFVYGSTLTPRQPAFADADYAVLSAAPSAWSVEGRYTADMDLTYANGAHDGMAYIANIIELYGTISGTGSVREHFTVSGGNRTISKAYVRVRRTSGSSPLTLRLETSSGTLIDSATVPASSVPASAAGGDNGGSVWVGVTFDSAHTLVDGTTYNLRLTTPSGTEYTAAPIREGTDVGLQSTAFRDGSGQSSSNGTSWADLYQYSPVDIQFYFR